MKKTNAAMVKLRALLDDDRGAVSAISMTLLTVLLALGAIVGLTVVRDHIAQEFGDMAVGLDNLDQSFSYQIVVDGVVCVDAAYVDDPATLSDPVDAAPACLVFAAAPGENGTIPTPSGAFP